MEDKKVFVISLGGSIVIPKPGGIDILFLRNFKNLILKFLKKGYQFIIIVGGGKICRIYQGAAKEVGNASSNDMDWLGIEATKLNAKLIQVIFQKQSYKKVIDNPLTKSDFSKAKIVIASGWKPGFSTDFDAVLFAKRAKAKTIINLSNIDFVYDSDVNIYKNAKPIKNISWNDYLKLVGEKWTPGLSTPFDPIAAKMANKLNKKVIIAKGANIKNLENILSNQKFIGTVIE